MIANFPFVSKYAFYPNRRYMRYLLGDLTQGKFDVKKPIAPLVDHPQILSSLAQDVGLQNIEYKRIVRGSDGYYAHILMIFH